MRAERLIAELERNPPGNLSPVRARQRAKAIALVREESLLEAMGYRCDHLPVERIDGGRVYVGGDSLCAPMLVPARGELTHLGFGACTLGDKLEARVTSLFRDKRAALALALDQVGNELLLALGRRLQDRLLGEVRRRRLMLGQELHAGDPGLELSAQALVLRLSGAEQIGISLYRDSLLHPLKSVSVVFAVGRDLPRVTLSRCERCPSRKRCTLNSQAA